MILKDFQVRFQMRTKPKFIIKDWMNNTCFKGITFKTFEDAWEYIYIHDPIPEETDPKYDEHWFDDYYVEEIGVSND